MQGTANKRDFLERVRPYQNLGTPIWIYDADIIKIIWANNSALDLWGASSIPELQSRDLQEGAVRASLDYLQSLTRNLAGEQRLREDWTIFPNQKPVRCQVEYTTIALTDGRPGLRIECLAHNAVATSDNARTIEALRHTTAMISSYDRHFNGIYANPAAKAASSELKLRERFLQPRRFDELTGMLENSDFASIDAKMRSGANYAWHKIQVQRCQDPLTGEPGYLVSETNITKERNAELNANAIAFTDKLTGLPNHSFLEQSLTQTIASHKTIDKPIAAIGINLDQFRNINSTLGRQAGDEAINQVAKVLRSEVQDSDVLVRSNADEFIILRTALPSYRSLMLFARRVIRKFRDPLPIKGQETKISPSIGIAVYPDDAASTQALMQSVDIALNHSKLTGGNTYTIFDMTMKRHLENKQRLENDLRAAIVNDELELYFQPRFGHGGTVITGAEALIRWNHPELGQLKPGDFIPIAEESGLIAELDDWVLEAGCAQSAQWSRTGYELRLSINLSASQFNNSQLLEKLEKTIARTGCRAQDLELEITESMLIEHRNNASRLLDSIHQMGISIAIDDFGTGYSNLAYLQSFAIDYLKIDRTFVANIEQPAILEMIISLGKMLGVTLVAEGVETSRQLKWLTNRGCHEFQGFHLGRPVALNVFHEKFLDACPATSESLMPPHLGVA